MTRNYYMILYVMIQQKLYLTTNNQIFNLLERLKKNKTHHRNNVVISSTVTLSYIAILPCQSTAARLIIVHSF